MIKLYFCFGLLIGIIWCSIINFIASKRKKIYGYINVDTSKNLCEVHITSSELSDEKTKEVLFRVNHTTIIKE